MLNRRSPAALIPGLFGGARFLPRGAAISSLPVGALAALRPAATPSVVPTDVPWAAGDVLRAVALAAILSFCGGCAYLLARVFLSVGFLFGEGFGVIRSGTFDHLCREFAAYSDAISTVLIGALVCGSVLFAVHRFTLVKYRLRWSALGFRHIGWRLYCAAACLCIPMALCGLIVTRTESILLGGPLHNPQTAWLTRGMPPLPVNFLLLFVLLTVLVPIAEETFFRGFLYRLLRKRLPVWASATASAAAFALLHGVPVLFPWLFFLGVVYALLAERTHSLFPGMVLHGMINGLATLSIVVVLSGW